MDEKLLLSRSLLAIRIFLKRSAFFFEKKKQKTFPLEGCQAQCTG
jgi:hypothetical protein